LVTLLAQEYVVSKIYAHQLQNNYAIQTNFLKFAFE